MNKLLKLLIAIIGIIAFIFIPYFVGWYVLQPDPIRISLFEFWLVGAMVTVLALAILVFLFVIVGSIYEWIMSDNW